MDLRTLELAAWFALIDNLNAGSLLLDGRNQPETPKTPSLLEQVTTPTRSRF
jgi:hypothetical protein